MKRSHLLSLAYLAFGVVTFVEASADVQNSTISLSLPGTSLSTLLLLGASIIMVAIAVGTLARPEWFSRETITFGHLLTIWAGVLLMTVGVFLEFTAAIL